MPVIACPLCGKALKLPAGYAKPLARCPSCRTKFNPGEVTQVVRADSGPQADLDIDFLLKDEEPPIGSPTAGPPPSSPVVMSRPTSELPDRISELPIITVRPPRRRFWATLLGILLVFASLAGCGALLGVAIHFLGLSPFEPQHRTPEPAPALILSEKQQAAVGDAIKALARIEAAAQVGVTLTKYMELVIDAKAAVNEADRLLPGCELLTNLDEAMRAYGDAGTVWNHKIKFRSLGLKKEYGHAETIARYNLPLNENGEADRDLAMQIMWQVAATKLAAARSLQ